MSGDQPKIIKNYNEAILALLGEITKNVQSYSGNLESLAHAVQMLESSCQKRQSFHEHPDTTALRNVCQVVNLSMDAARCLGDGTTKLSKKQLEWAQAIVEEVLDKQN